MLINKVMWEGEKNNPNSAATENTTDTTTTITTPTMHLN